jgi:hypothetical protein
MSAIDFLKNKPIIQGKKQNRIIIQQKVEKEEPLVKDDTVLETEEGKINVDEEKVFEEPLKIKNIVKFVDKTKDKNAEIFDMNAFRRGLVERNLTKVVEARPEIKPVVNEGLVTEQELLEPVQEPQEVKKMKRPVNLTKKRRVIFKEDGNAEEAIPVPVVVPVEQAPILQEHAPVLEEGAIIKRVRNIKEAVDKPLTFDVRNRFPPHPSNINIRASSYYMNNREMFIKFINRIFQPYKKELEDNIENISCDTIGQNAGEFSLLTHQKIVRDYINIYTPYRGLLLYHGLGSGKTCTSIAIAEGMKTSKRVIIMTPASLRRNYMEELKKCGDALYKRNQYWEWITTENNSNKTNLETLSHVLNLPQEYVKKQKGAWLINVSNPSNFDTLSTEQKKSLDLQLDEMIRSKYTFINYNGLRNKALSDLTNGYTENLFDNSVVIIDEGHNLISRIVNKIKKGYSLGQKQTKKQGEGENPPTGEEGEDAAGLPKALSLKLYEYLMSAQNAKVVILSGTPVINYPNEFGVLFNLLRGYIKTWKIPLTITTSQKIDKETLTQMFREGDEKGLDYLDYSPSTKILTITHNPFGFHNSYTDVRGVYNGVVYDSNYKVTDSAFLSRVLGILRGRGIDVNTSQVKVLQQKALPDTFDTFMGQYIDENSLQLKNVDGLKRRVVGLSSYFRSAQEGLLPKYEKETDYHLVKIPMSDYQFELYEIERKKERKTEKASKLKKPTLNLQNNVYKEATSSYRIFSRLRCNYAVENRPYPDAFKSNGTKEEETEGEGLIGKLREAEKKRNENDLSNENEGEIEGEDILNDLGGINYAEQVQQTLRDINDNPAKYLSPEGLKKYSPKFLKMLQNIQDPNNVGLHLVYSQIRTLEGIGIFSLVLEHNGFSRFQIKKEANGGWDMVESENENEITRGEESSDELEEINVADIEAVVKPQRKRKPSFVLYTGTESADEKEIVRNIYNGDWENVPTNIANRLRQISPNNNMGEVIKVFMITSSGSEGINLRNTRFVHIMEPYWHPVRQEQVIGRARRICSHKNLPKELQTVEVFMYLTVFSEEQLDPKGRFSDVTIELKKFDKSKITADKIVTSDETLYEISEIKSRFVSQLTDSIKQTSFDCSIYSGTNCISFGNEANSKAFSYVPNYLDQADDRTALLNRQQQVVTYNVFTANNGKSYKVKNLEIGVPGLYYIYDNVENPLVEVGTYEILNNGQAIIKIF